LDEIQSVIEESHKLSGETGDQQNHNPAVKKAPHEARKRDGSVFRQDNGNWCSTGDNFRSSARPQFEALNGGGRKHGRQPQSRSADIAALIDLSSGALRWVQHGRRAGGRRSVSETVIEEQQKQPSLSPPLMRPTRMLIFNIFV
jgi:hypothetical protein